MSKPSPDLRQRLLRKASARIEGLLLAAFQEGSCYERNDPSRAIHLRPSSFPFCPLRFFMDLPDMLSKGKRISASMAYYVRVGHVIHNVFQEAITSHDQSREFFVRDWKCRHCKHLHVLMTAPDHCEKCGLAFSVHEVPANLEHTIKEGNLIGHVDESFRFTHKENDYLVVIDYKGLALDTKLPTPKGWTTMGELKVGDVVFDSKGKKCRVIGKSKIHRRKCYRIGFNDGSSIVCDGQHKWVTTSGSESVAKSVKSVKTTEEIRRTLRSYRGQAHHRVELAGALDLPELDLPIHPYVLGCWLGDGTADRASISKPDKELFQNIEKCGYEIDGYPKNEICRTVKILSGLGEQLKNAGLLKNKHIPPEYLRANKKQRLLLLKGLMDTDGSWNRQRHQAVFSNCTQKLSQDLRELVNSLGGRALVNHAKARGFGKIVDVYQVTFRPVKGMNPFQLSRKADLVEQGSGARSLYRTMTSVEPIETVKTQCIEVDSQDSTYLCTDSMIITHNSTSSYKVKSGKLPQPSHISQLSAYAALLNKRHPVLGYVLVYIPRDNPNILKAYPFLLESSESKAILKKVDRWEQEHHSAMLVNTQEGLESLIKNRPCRTKEQVKEQYDECKFASYCTESNADKPKSRLHTFALERLKRRITKTIPQPKEAS